MRPSKRISRNTVKAQAIPLRGFIEAEFPDYTITIETVKDDTVAVFASEGSKQVSGSSVELMAKLSQAFLCGFAARGAQ